MSGVRFSVFSVAACLRRIYLNSWRAFALRVFSYFSGVELSVSHAIASWMSFFIFQLVWQLTLPHQSMNLLSVIRKIRNVWSDQFAYPSVLKVFIISIVIFRCSHELQLLQFHRKILIWLNYTCMYRQEKESNFPCLYLDLVYFIPKVRKDSNINVNLPKTFNSA